MYVVLDFKPSTHWQKTLAPGSFFTSWGLLWIFPGLRECGVSISAHPTMTRTSQNAKKAKISVYRPRGKKHRAGSSSTSMVVLKPTKTRRGKTIYTEVDAAPYYTSSDEEGKSLKRKPSKTPSHSKTTVPTRLEDISQLEASCLDDQEPCAPRITKVRLTLRCIVTV